MKATGGATTPGSDAGSIAIRLILSSNDALSSERRIGLSWAEIALMSSIPSRPPSPSEEIMAGNSTQVLRNAGSTHLAF
ncbi:hypothetical protein Q2941_29260 [Bradyrhizobium sp. UFLA05-153]